MSAQKAIFSPIKVGKYQLQHRVVLAPLTRFRATLAGVPGDLQAEYYQQRATEGGLLITEAAGIIQGGAYPTAPGIYTKEHIEGWKKTTAAVHEKKGTIFLQLWHIGRAGSKDYNANNAQVVSASNIPISGKTLSTNKDYETPRPLEIDEIKAIVELYRQAAVNAIEAGFDGVEIHSANGYLLDQFINTSSNKRTDIYGGSIENRTRFSLEVVDAIAEAIGEERTAIRFSPGGAFQDMQDDTVVDTWSHLTSEIQKNHPNLAYLHFIQARGNVIGDENVAPPDTLGPYRQIWKGPFVASSGYSNAIEAAVDLAEKTGDLISFGRTFIANPDLVERLRNGWELNPYDRSTFYTGGAVGYTDYPFYSETKN
jgi:2,4-dienoyl-CoA reductase-like NADH-dependent reductase (Old Yellow Enzyme family)